MKKILFLVIYCFWNFNLFSQIVVTGHVFAEVIENLSVAEQNTLNFGKFSISAEGGTISISPEGVLTTTGGITVTPGMNNPATFKVTGQKDACFSVSLPKDEVFISDGRSSKMTVSRWMIDENKDKITLSEGSQTISIGATLIVSNRESNPKGSYYGTYSVRFNYN